MEYQSKMVYIYLNYCWRKCMKYMAWIRRTFIERREHIEHLCNNLIFYLRYGDRCFGI